MRDHSVNTNTCPGPLLLSSSKLFAPVSSSSLTFSIPHVHNSASISFEAADWNPHFLLAIASNAPPTPPNPPSAAHTAASDRKSCSYADLSRRKMLRSEERRVG